MSRSMFLASWVMLALLAGDSPADQGGRTADRPGSGAARIDPVGAFRIPVHFESNRGQASPGVDFVARSASLSAHLSREGALLLVGGLPVSSSSEVPGGREDAPSPVITPLPIRWEGVDPDSTLRSDGDLPGKSHYLLGSDAGRWIRNVPHARAVLQRGAWPGIDLRWVGSDSGGLAFRFVVRPGADPGLIRFRFPGALAPALDGAGDLVVATTLGPVVLRAPTAFQRIAGRTIACQAAFSVGADGLVALRVGAWSNAHALIVGPEIDYSSYCYAAMNDIAVDADGSVHACGAITASYMFTAVNAFQPVYAGDGDGYVVKLDPSATTVEYATYIGGKYVGTVASGTDRLNGIAIDPQGRAMVGGESNADNYPTTAGAFQKLRGSHGANSNLDAVLTLFSEDGSSLVWSSYLGSQGRDQAKDILFNAAGDVVVYGQTTATGFPLKDAAQATYGGNEDAFVTVVNATGTAIVRSSYFGGASNEFALRARLDGQGRVCLVGYTASTNLPVVNAYQSTLSGTADCYLARMAADGKSFELVTYLGGSSQDVGWDMDLGPQDRWFVVGMTNSTNFPLSNPLEAQFGGGSHDAFLSVFDADVTELQFSTYLGGAGYDVAKGVAVDATGAPVVVGMTRSADFPLVAAIDSELAGTTNDLFLTRITPDLTEITWSTFFGGTADDDVVGVSDGIDDDLWVSVSCLDGPFPVQGGFLSSQQISAFFRVDLPAVYTNAPSNLRSLLLSLSSARISWNDPGTLETGFRLQWRVGAGEWEDLVILDANDTSHDVTGLAPEGVYEFRVSAFNDLAETPFAGPISVTMPPTPLQPPTGPSGLTATVLGPVGVELSWQDNGSDETFFQLVRATVVGGPFTTIATPSLNTTSWTDEDVRPDREYRYMVKAVNSIGSSLFSNQVSAETPATLAPTLVSGKITDSPTLSRDRVLIVLDLGEGAPDLREQGLVLRIGDGLGPTFVVVPGGDLGWKTRRTRATWRSPRDALSRVLLKYDMAAGTLRVRVAKAHFPQPLSLPLRVTLEIGDEGGHADAEWVPGRRAGQLKFP